MCGGQCTMGLGVVLGDPGSRALANNRGGICEVCAWFVRRNESCIFVDPPQATCLRMMRRQSGAASLCTGGEHTTRSRLVVDAPFKVGGFESLGDTASYAR